MNIKRRSFLAVVLVALAAARSQTAGIDPAQRAGSSIVQAPGAIDAVVANVQGETIRLSDLEAYSRRADPKGLFQLNQQLFDFREQMLDGLLGDRLLARTAARQGLSVEALLDRDLTPAPVTDAEIVETFERSQQAQAAAGEPPVGFDAARPIIEVYLAGRHRAEAKARYVRQLREQAGPGGVSVSLPVPRQAIPVLPSDPVRGSGVEIIEFADFECPYCRQLEPVLQALLQRFEGQVKLVWKDYPLPEHPFALDAAVAARCAGEQHLFWEYRALLFEQPAIRPPDLEPAAERLGLDLPRFRECLAQPRHRETIAAAAQQASTYGIAATPTLFINGRMVTGVKPLDTYERIVSQELHASR